MIRLITYVTIISVLCAGVLLTLKWTSDLPNEKDNGFNRVWKSTLIKKNHFKYNLDLVRISGVGVNRLYFTSIDPAWAVEADYQLNPKDSIIFGIKTSEKLINSNIIIDSNEATIIAPNIPMVIKRDLKSNKIDTIRLKTPIFTRSDLISREKIVVRGLDSSEQNQVFKIINTRTGNVNKEAELIKNILNDAGFSNDGYLKRDKLSNKIVYVKMYDNTFIIMDSSLNLLNRFHTIDTTFMNKVKVEVVKDRDTYKLMATNAREMVNNAIAVNNGFLYVLSNLRADNESHKSFNQAMPLDVYDIHTGMYLYSHKVARMDGRAAIDLLIVNDYLFVLYEKGNISSFSFR